jgi:flagellar M-ring protein FliF
VDFLNRTIAQISELFRALSPAARITTALLLVAIVLSIALLFNHQFAGGDRYLFGGEPVAFTEINAMTAAFGKAGLKDFELEGNRIRVPHGKYADYMAALADAGVLPRNFLDPMKKSLEGNSIIVDRKTREEKIKVAQQEQLAEIVSRMRGIEWATVMYNVENQISLDAKRTVTASVTVKPVGSQTLTDDQVQKIRLAVGPPIGATPESVSVIDDNGTPYPGATPGDPASGKNELLATKQKYEQQYAQRIRQAISFVPGAIVVVNVDLNSELDNSIPAATSVDPRLIPAPGQTESAPVRSNTSLPGSPSSPLAQQGLSNMPAIIANLVGGHARTVSSAADRTTQDMSDSSQSQVRRPIPLTPKRVTASIGIPASYYEDVWRRQQPGLSLMEVERQEQAKIEKYVLPQLPIPEGAAGDAASRLVVRTFQPVSAPLAEKPTTQDRALAWCGEHAGPIGMGFLGLVSLLMVRSIARSPTRVSAKDSHDKLTIAREDTDGQWPTSNSARSHASRTTTEPSLRDELVDMVRDDPDAAANVLRRWISAAS